MLKDIAMNLSPQPEKLIGHQFGPLAQKHVGNKRSPDDQTLDQLYNQFNDYERKR
jgi:hypothetical protein